MGCLGAYFMKWRPEEKKCWMDRSSNDHGQACAEGSPVQWAFCFYPAVLPGNVDKKLSCYCQSHISLWSILHILYNTSSVHFIGGDVSYACPANPPVFFFGSADICLSMLCQQRKLETGKENRKVMGKWG